MCDGQSRIIGSITTFEYVDGYTDFIFINRFGQPQHQATLNKAIRRIIRDCNDENPLWGGRKKPAPISILEVRR